MEGMKAAKERVLTYAGGKGHYKLPNDPTEQDRLDQQASAYFELLGNRHYLAPLSCPQHMLDIGCGTGAVTAVMAAANPTASVTGVDLTPVPPRLFRPPNIEFLQGDIRELVGARLPWGSMDLVFSRLLLYGMTEWQDYVDLAARMARPGGYVEMQELVERWYERAPDGGAGKEVDLKVMAAMREGAARQGLDLEAGGRLAARMRKAGLEVVQEVEFKYTIGDWMREEMPNTGRLGKMKELDRSLMCTAVGKILEGQRTEDEIRELQRELLDAWDGPKLMYLPLIVVVGRKPL